MELVSKNNIDIAILTETWLSKNDTHIISILSSPPYKFVNFHRKSSGGVIGILYHSSFVVISSCSYSIPSCELSYCSLPSSDSRSNKIISIYLPPSSFISDFIDYNHPYISSNTFVHLFIFKKCINLINNK